VPHNFDDVMLQQILDSAEEEARLFLNLDELTESSSETTFYQMAPAMMEGVFMLCMASYGAPTADEVAAFRKAAEVKLFPYRTGLGV